MTALIEVACPRCGSELWARPEDAGRPAPCAQCRANQEPTPGSRAAFEAELRRTEIRRAMAEAKAARAQALGAPEPTPIATNGATT